MNPDPSGPDDQDPAPEIPVTLNDAGGCAASLRVRAWHPARNPVRSLVTAAVNGDTADVDRFARECVIDPVVATQAIVALVNAVTVVLEGLALDLGDRTPADLWRSYVLGLACRDVGLDP